LARRGDAAEEKNCPSGKSACAVAGEKGDDEDDGALGVCDGLSPRLQRRRIQAAKNGFVPAFVSLSFPAKAGVALALALTSEPCWRAASGDTSPRTRKRRNQRKAAYYRFWRGDLSSSVTLLAVRAAGGGRGAAAAAATIFSLLACLTSNWTYAW